MDILPLFPYIMAGMSARIWPTRAESESGKGRGPCWELDGTGEFWWVEAHKVRDLAAEIRLASDTLLRWSRS